MSKSNFLETEDQRKLRDRLVDAAYRVHDWKRHAKPHIGKIYGDDAIALFDRLLFANFTSLGDYETFKNLPLGERASEAIASHVLLRSLIELRERDSVQNIKDDIIVPTFMEILEEEISGQGLGSEQQATVIRFLNDEVFKAVKFTKSALQLHAGANAEIRQTFRMNRNPRFRDLRRRIDATCRAAAYDAARHELFTQSSQTTPWKCMSDADLARVAALVYQWLYQGKNQEFGVRAIEWHEKQPTQRADLQATPKDKKQTRSGEILHPFVAAMRQELKRIRHQKKGNEYPKPIGHPYAEIVGVDHPFLRVSVKKQKSETLTELRQQWEDFGVFNPEIEDGSKYP